MAPHAVTWRHLNLVPFVQNELIVPLQYVISPLWHFMLWRLRWARRWKIVVEGLGIGGWRRRTPYIYTILPSKMPIVQYSWKELAISDPDIRSGIKTPQAMRKTPSGIYFLFMWVMAFMYCKGQDIHFPMKIFQMKLPYFPQSGYL